MNARLVTLALLGTLVVGCAAAADEVGSGTSDLTSAGEDLGALRDAVADVEVEHVVLPGTIATPTADVSSGTRSDSGASLTSLDWYQKWAGGKTAAHAWSDGSDAGKRCAWASVLRFEAIIKDAPPELEGLLALQSKWTGTFQNWNNDYGGKTADGKPAYGNASGAYIFAPRSDVAKWVSATARDGSCFLPTKAMLVEYLSSCKAQVTSNGGDPKGCEAPATNDE